MIDNSTHLLETATAALAVFEPDAVADDRSIATAEGHLDSAADLELVDQRVGHQVVELAGRTRRQDHRGNQPLLGVVELPGSWLPIEQTALLFGHRGGNRGGGGLVVKATSHGYDTSRRGLVARRTRAEWVAVITY